MSDTSNFGFGKFVPGFDFLQSLAKGASSSIPQMPSLSNWVAPTISVEELEKRIDELKAVQFWLEQNSRALTATVQALEVQKMTLATLKGMNFSMGDVANAFKVKATDSGKSGLDKAADSFASRAAATAPAAPAPQPAEPAKPAPADGDQATKEAEPSVVDPMQWWGALTSQFQQIAANVLKDAAQQTAAIDTTKTMAAEAIKTATEVASQFAAQGMQAVQGARRTAASAAKAPTAKKAAAKKAPAPSAAKPTAKKATARSAPRKPAG